MSRFGQEEEAEEPEALGAEALLEAVAVAVVCSKLAASHTCREETFKIPLSL